MTRTRRKWKWITLARITIWTNLSKCTHFSTAYIHSLSHFSTWGISPPFLLLQILFVQDIQLSFVVFIGFLRRRPVFYGDHYNRRGKTSPELNSTHLGKTVPLLPTPPLRDITLVILLGSDYWEGRGSIVHHATILGYKDKREKQVDVKLNSLKKIRQNVWKTVRRMEMLIWMLYCSCSGRARGERREPVDTEDRNSHYPLLPGESDQRAMGGSVWSRVTKESLSFHHGKAREKLL